MNAYLVAWVRIEELPKETLSEGRFFTIAAETDQIAETIGRQQIELIAINDPKARFHSVHLLGPADNGDGQ
jgi:hypothetical protein